MPAPFSLPASPNSPQRHVEIFFYGLYQDPAMLREHGVYPERSHPACVRHRRLRLGRHSTLLHDDIGVAWGTVFELTHDDIDRLYAGRGLTDYCAEAVLAESRDGRTRAVLCYVLRQPPAQHETNPDYREKLAKVVQGNRAALAQLDCAAHDEPWTLDIQLPWLLDELAEGTGTHETTDLEICQCGSAAAIRQGADPERLLGVFCAYVFLNQFIHAHFRSSHARFRGEFPGPVLLSHPTGSHASPAWLLDPRGHGLTDFDCVRVARLIERLIADGIAWLRNDSVVDTESLHECLRTEVCGTFPWLFVSVQVDVDRVVDIDRRSAGQCKTR